MRLLGELEVLLAQALEKIHAQRDTLALEQYRVELLGKKGQLTTILRSMGALSPDERPVVGQRANEVRDALTAALGERSLLLGEEELSRRLLLESIDVTMPGKVRYLGHKHPLNRIIE